MPTSLLARFIDQFLRGFGKTMKGLMIDGGLLVATIIYASFTGKFSLETWKHNTWEAVTPLIWLLCFIAVAHGFMAARSLVVAVEHESHFADSAVRRIIRPDGVPAYLAEFPVCTPFYRAKIYGIAFCLLLFSLLLAYLSWSASKPPTQLNSFAVHPGFAHAFSIYGSRLGKIAGPPEAQVGGPGTLYGAVQSNLERSDLIFLNSPCKSYFLLEDERLLTYPCDMKESMTCAAAKLRFRKPTRNEIYPLFGLGALYEAYPKLLGQLGYQHWQADFPNGSVYSQVFDNGLIIGSVRRVAPERENPESVLQGRIYIILEKEGKWESDDTDAGQAPKGAFYRLPNEDSICSQ